MAPGRIARQFARGLQVIDGACLYAVASSSRQRAEQFTTEVGNVERIYTSYRELVSDPAVDAVYIANPHRYHHDSVALCLEAGKPVLCEKPLTVTARESQELINLAQQKQVFLMEALWSRFLPAWVQVRQWVEEGRVGEVRVMSSTFGVQIPREVDDRLLNRESAGGVLLDMGVYNVAMSQFIMQCDPEIILADGVIGETGVDERSSGLLNYGGPVSVFTCNFQVNTTNDFNIYGSKGHIRVAPNFWEATAATLTLDTGEVEEFSQPFRATGFEYEAEEAMRYIQAGQLQSDVMPWQHTLGNMRTMDEMLTQIGMHYPFSSR
jgi:predicted dehydrogenase